MLSRASHLTFWIGSLIILSFLSWIVLLITIPPANPEYQKNRFLSREKNKFEKY